MVRLAQRTAAQAAYPFAALIARKREIEARGRRVLDLSIGDSVLGAPEAAVAALCERGRQATHHHYSSYQGIYPFRAAVAAWMTRRFGVTLDPDHEITALMGSKEGLFRFPQAILDPGDAALYPDPGYPVYPHAIAHAGGEPIALNLTEKNAFLPDIAAIPDELARRVRLVFVNAPANPTGAVADADLYRSLYERAERYDWIICADSAYCEIYEGAPPPAALQFDPEKRRTIEFFSFSKSYSMTGWRLGWACGNAKLVQALIKVKGLQDSAVFEPVQYAGIAALDLPQSAIEPLRRFYADNRARIRDAFAVAGHRCFDGRGTFYVWSPVPKGLTAAGFADRLLVDTGVLVTPGTVFGPNGEGWFRIAATRSPEEIAEAAERIAGWEGGQAHKLPDPLHGP